jgi:hypothetical protein
MKVFVSIILMTLGLVSFGQQVNKVVVSIHNSILWAPGIKIGVEHELTNGVFQKQRRKKLKTKYKELFILPSISYNNQKHTYKSIHPSIDFGYRRVGQKGFKYEVLWGTGYMKTITSGSTYEVVDGIVKKRDVFSGRSYLTQNIAFGFGQDLTKKCLPLSWHVRLNSSFLIPYNSFYLPQLNFEAGISFLLFHKKLLY